LAFLVFFAKLQPGSTVLSHCGSWCDGCLIIATYGDVKLVASDDRLCAMSLSQWPRETSRCRLLPERHRPATVLTREQNMRCNRTVRSGGPFVFLSPSLLTFPVFGWKGRDTVQGCAGKTVKSIDHAFHTLALWVVLPVKGAISSARNVTFTFRPLPVPSP